MRLAFAWVLAISLLAMVVITVVRFGKNPIDSEQKIKNQLLISWVAVIVIRIVAMVWPRTGIFKYILANIISMGMVYRLTSIVISWTKIVALTVALVHTVRFLRRKK